VLNPPARVNNTVTENIGKKLAPTDNQSEHNSSITPAYDTNPLDEKELTEDQKTKVRDINNLLKEIKRVSTSINDNKKKDLWAIIDQGKGNNVILIEGKRGAGKTSFLLTLIYGWENLDKNTKDSSNPWDGMSSVVRALQPLDFDPIPPELPIFSWIIQAFTPWVNHISKKKYNCCDTKVSIQQIYQELQRTVTVGWTTGLLARKSEKDLDDFFLWQAEQQIEWQKLKRKWIQFINIILKHLEHSNKLPHDGLIVLPIDDLDMQVNRTRELLLTLRMLYHPRLVYILTGDVKNTDVALSTSFYREFTRNSVFIDGGLLDKIIEQSEILGQSIRKKTIPASQVFEIKGIPLNKLMYWTPPYLGKDYQGDQPNFGKLIQRFSKSWVGNSDQDKLTSLFTNTPHNIDHYTFRDLQNFFDKWRNNEKENEYFSAIIDFLRIILENPSEESLYVGQMNNIANEEIYITGKPGIGTVSPRKVSSKTFENPRITIHWSNNYEFSRKSLDEFGKGQEYQSASREYLLALEIEQQFKDQIEIDHSLRFVEPSLGIIWTETSDRIVPWPIGGKIPKSPLEWVDLYSDWNAFINVDNIELSKLSSEDLILQWVSFLSKVNGQWFQPNAYIFQSLYETPYLERFDNLAVFGHTEMGLSDWVIDQIRMLFDQSEIDGGKIGQAWERLALKPNKPIKSYSLDELTFLAYESESQED